MRDNNSITNPAPLQGISELSSRDFLVVGFLFIMAGYRNNNLQNAGADATPEEINSLISYAVDVFKATPPDLHNPEEVQQAILNYFYSCKANGTRPGNLGLYAALGMSKQDVHNAVTGKYKQRVSPECVDLLKKAQQAMGAYREGLALKGKLNPVTYIFMGKNYDGLQDQTQIEVTAAPGAAATMTPEEIARQIEQDIPIDGDYKEADS